MKLTDGVVEDEERAGREMSCPSCAALFKFTVMNIVPMEDIYLYCDACSNFVLREEDREQAINAKRRCEHTESLSQEIKYIYRNLEQSLPACECGGHFRLWSNVKCPVCHYEFPYNNGVRDIDFRIQEGRVIWVEGATIYRGELQHSNKLISVKKYMV